MPAPSWGRRTCQGPPQRAPGPHRLWGGTSLLSQNGTRRIFEAVDIFKGGNISPTLPRWPALAACPRGRQPRTPRPPLCGGRSQWPPLRAPGRPSCPDASSSHGWDGSKRKCFPTLPSVWPSDGSGAPGGPTHGSPAPATGTTGCTRGHAHLPSPAWDVAPLTAPQKGWGHWRASPICLKDGIRLKTNLGNLFFTAGSLRR